MAASFKYNKDILPQYTRAILLNTYFYLIQLSVSLVFQGSVKNRSFNKLVLYKM